MKTAVLHKERFWLAWIVANAVGWTAAVFVLPAIGSLVSPLFSLPPGWLLDLRIHEAAQPLVALIVGTAQSLATLTVVGAVLGIILGLAQWLVLRAIIPHSNSWIAATAIGSAVGWSIGLMATFVFFGESTTSPESALVRSFVLGGAIGVALGLAQWVPLRGFTQAANAWLLATLLGWTVGLAVGWGLASILALALSPQPDVSNMPIRVALISSLIGPVPGIIGGAITGIALTRMLQGPSDKAWRERL